MPCPPVALVSPRCTWDCRVGRDLGTAEQGAETVKSREKRAGEGRVVLSGLVRVWACVV